MAEDALERLVVAGVDVALAAARPPAPVRARVDREVAAVVVEARGPPGRRAVAALAVDGEPGGLVVGVGGGCVVRPVAGVAVGGCPLVATADVAPCAVHGGVGPGQGEACLAVVELGRPPGVDRVAALAGGRESAGDVVGIGGPRVVALVAGHARGRRTRVAATGVAPGAGESGVPAREGEARRVGKDGALPGRGRHVVAVLAASREAGLDMVRVRRLQVGLEMAVAAFRRGVLVLVGLLAAVARGAVEPGVRGEEREAGPAVGLEHLALVRPRGGRVARVALEAHLAAVGVPVAIGAVRPHAVEDERPVAAAARDLRMGGLQHEAGRVVAEGGGLVHRDPLLRVVALGAVELKIAVRRLAGALSVQHQHRDEGERRKGGGDDDTGAAHWRSPFAGTWLGPWHPRHVVGSGL